MPCSCSSPAPTSTRSSARANARLADHQKIRAAAVWPAGELPRTDGTRKLKRRELKAWIAGGRDRRAARRRRARPIAGVSARRASRQDGPSRPETTVDELGLSSLERVELMMALEEAFQVTVDEARFGEARTVGDLDALTQPLEPATAAHAASVATADRVVRVPGLEPGARRVGRCAASACRRGSCRSAACSRASRSRGLEHLEGLARPGDLRRQPSEPLRYAGDPRRAAARAGATASPLPWRRSSFARISFPAQATRGAYVKNSANYYLAALFFNAFPLPQREAGTRQTLRYIGELVRPRLFHPDLSRRPTDRRREHRPVPARRRDDRGPARGSGRAGSTRRPGPHPSSFLEVPSAAAPPPSALAPLSR